MKVGDGESIDRLTGFRVDYLHLTSPPVVLLTAPLPDTPKTPQSIKSAAVGMQDHDGLSSGAVCPDVCPLHRPS